MPRALRQLLLPATLGLSLLLAAAPSVSFAQYSRPDVGSLDKPVEPYAFGEVGVDERLGNLVPKDLKFRDEAGKSVALSDYLTHGRPIVLWMGYYECPMLCDLMSAGMVKSVKGVQLDAGQEFAILNVSIDPNESSTLARDKKATYLKELGQPGNAAAWNLLTGSPESIRALAEAVGYKFKKVTVQGESQYAHPAVLMILAPDGKVTRYLYPDGNQGVNFDTRTMQLSLIEASNGTVGSTLDKVLLTCLRYDSHTGRYTWIALNLMKGAGALTVLGMAAVLVPIWIRSARRKPAATDEQRPLGPSGHLSATPY